MNRWKYLGPAILALMDGGITLAGQTREYWSDYQQTNEMSPIFAAVLRIHPLAFVLAVLIWIAGFCLLIRFLPGRLSLVTSVSFMTGHFMGFLTWVFYHYQASWYLVFLLVPLFSYAVIRVVAEEMKAH